MSFELNSITQKIKTLERNAAIRGEVAGIVPMLETASKKLQETETEKNNLAIENNKLKVDFNALQVQQNLLKKQTEELLNKNRALEEKLEKLGKESPSIQIEEIGNSLNNSLKVLEKKLGTAEKDGTSYFVDKFEIELKSGLDLSGGLKIVQPKITDMTAEGLSTLRISMKSKPKLTIAKE